MIRYWLLRLVCGLSLPEELSKRVFSLHHPQDGQDFWRTGIYRVRRVEPNLLELEEFFCSLLCFWMFITMPLLMNLQWLSFQFYSLDSVTFVGSISFILQQFGAATVRRCRVWMAIINMLFDVGCNVRAWRCYGWTVLGDHGRRWTSSFVIFAPSTNKFTILVKLYLCFVFIV